MPVASSVGYCGFCPSRSLGLPSKALWLTLG
jgi:hypothetical protein